jgi:hypothetical protein
MAEDAIMQFEVKFGSVSWINKDPNPIWLAAKAEILVPEWVPKTYIGLVATANDEPPDQIQDIIAFQDKQQFRAFTHCHLGVVVDDSIRKSPRWSRSRASPIPASRPRSAWRAIRRPE